MTLIDDDTWAMLLAATDEALPDAGFTAAVMRRVQVEEAQHLAPTQDAASALARLDRLAASPRTRRWRWIGVAAGSLVALLTAAAAPAPLVQSVAQALALSVGLITTAWVLATHALGND